MLLKSSTDRCVTEPLPPDPNRNWPGLALARAMNCFTEDAGIEGCTTNTNEVEATTLIGEKSRIGS